MDKANGGVGLSLGGGRGGAEESGGGEMGTSIVEQQFKKC